MRLAIAQPALVCCPINGGELLFLTLVVLVPFSCETRPLTGKPPADPTPPGVVHA